MINLYDGQITDLLQNTLKYNPETQAVAYAVLQEKRRLMDLVERTRLMSDVDNLDERILDYLAVELRTPAYEDSLPVETKRTLIKGTLPFYAKLGTPAAVNWVIQAIFGNGEIEEWFQYGGDPHFFRVNVPIAGMITPEMMEGLRRMIASVKRLTSWLDAIITYLEMAGEVHITPFLGQPLGITTLPVLEPDFPGTLVHFTPVLGDGPQVTTLPPLEPVFPVAAILARASGAAHTITDTSLPTLAEKDTVMPDLVEHATSTAQNIAETVLPYLEALPPDEMAFSRGITARLLLPLLETRLPDLEDFNTEITAVCQAGADAALQTITETKLPEMEEL